MSAPSIQECPENDIDEYRLLCENYKVTVYSYLYSINNLADDREDVVDRHEALVGSGEGANGKMSLLYLGCHIIYCPNSNTLRVNASAIILNLAQKA